MTGKTEASAWIRQALEKYQGPLIRYACRLTGDFERARDVVQDTFLRLCRERPERVQDHLARWLFRVCRNRALDVLKKENRMTSLSIVPQTAWESPTPDPGHRLEQEDQLQRISEILGKLSENQQEVVRLRFESGLSYKEISDVTGMTISNVGFLLHTALKKIREALPAAQQSPHSPVRRAQ